ncbi:phage portal protein [Roseomonas terrae]|uniref:Phage portal protein n=1 Tax=Neoroseomonas terrae TaxID=424799 RepID=A0ABS5EET2_9PROT|nr:phage portal protein [Neoroseomonas terrae]MBR0649522.1 phage portal protein [Neoroseomonas terrae]
MSTPTILGADGLPIARSSGRRLASAGGYQAGDLLSQELAGWNPLLTSPDAAMGFSRRTVMARIADLVRNDGWASGAVTRIVDGAVGADLRPAPKPDFRSLAWYSPAFDARWAAEFTTWAKGCWRDWAHDPACWADTARQGTIPDLFRLGFRTMLVEGDALGLVSWRPERLAYGRGVYATTTALVAPSRLSNPNDGMDTDRMRAGVELDADGAAVAYHFREAHPGDFTSSPVRYAWRRWVRETRWGRPVVVHYFERDEIEQHRGVGVLTPVLARMKALTRYDGVELQAAIVNAIFAAYVQSPFDTDLVQEALGDGGSLPAYQQARADFHADKRLAVNGVRLAHLFPGETINTIAANRPSGNYPDFVNAVLRNIASATGQSEMQVSQDWSRTNYSSARAALLETWKTLTRRRHGFARGFAHPIWCAFLEEAMERDAPPLPAGAPDYVEMRAAYSRADWRGPGRGYIDPVKEPAGAQLRMEAGLSTLEHEAAENSGMDWEDVLDQRAREIEAFRQRGLPVPGWAGQVAAASLAPEPQDGPVPEDAS